MWLFVLFVAVPIVEIALFIEVGGFIGLWPTLAIVIATAFAGSALMRRQGMGALADLQRSMDEGRSPGGALAHGALILFAGALLLTPGFFTDAVGLALLIPPVRAAAIAWGARRIAARGTAGFTFTVRGGAGPARGPRPGGASSGGPGEVIDGEFEAIDGEDGATPGSGADDDQGPQHPGGPPSGWTRS